jgi:predicted CxxxxCH...CXXCH cytochrome family protein
MKYSHNYLILILVIIAGLSACSKLNEDIPTPAAVEVHGEGNLNPDSDNFHGYKVADSELEKKLVECQQCHGGDYTGGITTQSCTGCHTGIQVHTGPEYITSDHFTYFYNNEKSLGDCWNCHGEDYSGGIASPTCETCHDVIEVHASGTTAMYHADYLPTVTWEMEGCQRCHGNDYAGKENRISPSCLTCHSGEGGPEACNTCHGQFSDPSRIAPPDGLNNKEDQTQFVGAHTAHMYEAQISYNLECGECHNVPSDIDDEGHIDDGDRAEINFGQIRAEALTTPTYSQGELSCSNTYCHGNFQFNSITGNNRTVSWLEEDEADCGSCHGQDIDGTLSPLPIGHFGSYLKEQCYMCHPNVVDDTGTIIGPDLHINGEANF